MEELIRENEVQVMPLLNEDGGDRLAKFRAQVAAEKIEPKARMSDTAAANLRAIREQEKSEDIAAGRFKTALAEVIVNHENLRKLVERCNTSVRPAQVLDRMAAKLGYWISSGYLLGREIDTVCLINFFSYLLPEEVLMSDTRFASEWNLKGAEKRRASRVNRGVGSEETASRLCKSGKSCIRFANRKPAPAKGRGEYCSPICAASDKARQKRGLAAMPSSVN
jgi:hypothetical protein